MLEVELECFLDLVWCFLWEEEEELVLRSGVDELFSMETPSPLMLELVFAVVALDFLVLLEDLTGVVEILWVEEDELGFSGILVEEVEEDLTDE